MILDNEVLKQPSLRLLPSHCYPLFAASSSGQKFTVYSVIQKDGLNFAPLYLLNYTWYVNDVHNI